MSPGVVLGLIRWAELTLWLKGYVSKVGVGTGAGADVWVVPEPVLGQALKMHKLKRQKFRRTKA